MATSIPSSCIRPDGFRRLGPDGIRDGKGGQHTVVLQQVHDTPALRSVPIGELREFWWETRALPSQQIRATDDERSAIDNSAAPEPRDGLEVLSARDLQPSLAGALDDGSRDRVLGVLLSTAAALYRAVRGNASPGPHENEVTFAELRDPNLPESLAGIISRHPRRRVGQ